jgi:DNA-binding transcriptional MerR regulator
MPTQSKPKKQSNKPSIELPPIPDKLYFTISEVSKLCDTKTHVLRYWEQEFEVLNPVKRRGNRRFYQQKDVLLVRQIREFLYIHGFTVEGAKAQLALTPTPSSDILLLQNILESLTQMQIILSS